MDHSSIETLEPRWSPARLIAGPLPAEFGATLPSISAEEAQTLVVQLPEIDPLHHGMIPPPSGGPFTQGTIQINDPAGLVITGAGTLVLSGSQLGGSTFISGGTLSMGSGGSLSMGVGGSLSTGFGGYPPQFFNQAVITSPGVILNGTITFSHGGTVFGVADTVAGFRPTLTVDMAAQFVGGGELPPGVLDQLSVAGPKPISLGLLQPQFILGSSLV
jgi:autotransporter-associated beta strand protein